MKTIFINKQMYDVITVEEYQRKKKINNEITRSMINESAIEDGDYVYPILPVTNDNKSNMVGVSDYGMLLKFNRPQTEEEKQMYNKDNVIDFEHSNSLKETIQKVAKLDSMEKTILINKDNIYNISVNENDTPEFALLKEAINRKQIDINSYKSRFDDSFSNNMRLLSTSNSITFGKMKAFADVFDLDLELTIKDKPGCVNPVGEVLHSKIT